MTAARHPFAFRCEQCSSGEGQASARTRFQGSLLRVLQILAAAAALLIPLQLGHADFPGGKARPGFLDPLANDAIIRRCWLSRLICGWCLSKSWRCSDKQCRQYETLHIFLLFRGVTHGINSTKPVSQPQPVVNGAEGQSYRFGPRGKRPADCSTDLSYCFSSQPGATRGCP